MHKIMVPYNVKGNLSNISEGKFTVNDIVATIQNGVKTDIGLSSWWTVRTVLPVLRKLPPEEPLLTGQRVLDTFFPVAKGGTAAIPRSEERRVGKECRSRRSAYHYKKKKNRHDHSVLDANIIELND